MNEQNRLAHPFIHGVTQLTVKSLLFVTGTTRSGTQVPTLGDTPGLFYYSYNKNFDEQKNILSTHFNIPTVASATKGCLGAGNSCWLGHQIQRLRGKSLEHPPFRSVPYHMPVLPCTVSIIGLLSVCPGPDTKPSDVSVRGLAYPGCWNFRHIITAFSWEEGKRRL